MPIKADKKCQWDRLQIRVGLQAEAEKPVGSLTDVSCYLEALCQWAPNAADVETGFLIRCVTNTGGTGPASADVIFEFPLLGVDTSYNVGSAFTSVIEAVLEFDNWRVYFLADGTWRLKFAAARLMVDGVVRWSVGAQTFDSDYAPPTGIPVWGMMPEFSAGASYNPEETRGLPSQTCEVVPEEITRGYAADDGSSGYRYRLTPDGAWITCPVLVSLEDPPTQTCDATSPAIVVPNPTTTWGCGVSGEILREYSVVDAGTIECDCPPGQATIQPAIYRLYEKAVDVSKYANSVRLIPDLTKAVRRWNSTHYRSPVDRYGSPATQCYISAICRDWISGLEDPDVETVSDDYVDVHPSLSVFLESVTNAIDDLEEPFGFHSYSPASASAERFLGQRTCYELEQAAICELVGPDEVTFCGGLSDLAAEQVLSSSFPGFVEDSGDNPDLAAWLDHADPVVRYLNMVCCPHLLFGLFFPADTIDSDADLIPDQQDQWEVDGGPIAHRYWTDSRYQMDKQASLPAPTDRRCAVVSEPLSKGRLALFWKAIFGTETSPWGVCNFDADIASNAFSSLALAASSEPYWTFTNCTAAFTGSGITLTPTGSNVEIEAKFDIGRFVLPDFLGIHICDRFTVDWVETGVVSAAVLLEGASGTTKVQATEPGTYPRVIGNDDAYAGSWGQDFGAGYILTDSGVDSLPAGESAAYMADPEQVFAFGLLAGRTADSIRFAFEVDDPSTEVELDYPIFLRSASDGVLYHENGNHSVVVWPNGPGIRWGQHAHFYDGSLHAVPTVFPIGIPPFGWKSSVLDWLIFRRQVLEGVAYDSGLFAELQAMYDSEEADQGSAAEMYEEVDDGTISFLVPGPRSFPIGITVNSCEYPPICQLPHLARDANMQPTGVPIQEAWSLIEERRVYIGNSPTHIFDGATQWSVNGTAPAGWFMTYHLHALANDEGSGFLIKRGGTEIAQASPYHGYFSVWAAGGEGLGAAGVHLDWAQMGLLVEPRGTEDGVRVKVYNVEADPWSVDYEVGANVADNTVQVACGSDGSWMVVYDSAGSTYITRTRSLGALWVLGPEEELISGTHPAVAKERRDDIEAIAVYDAGTWKCYVKRSESESFALAGSIVAVGTAYPAGLEWAPERGRSLVFTYSDGSEILRKKSSDLGATWESISL